MPITFSIDSARRRLFTVATGLVTYSEAMAHLDEERDDGGLPFSEFADATRAIVNFSAAEVRQIVERLRDLGQRDALGPSAVLVGDDLSFGVMRMLGTMTEDVCDIRPFRDRREAEDWLDAMPPPGPPTKER